MGYPGCEQLLPQNPSKFLPGNTAARHPRIGEGAGKPGFPAPLLEGFALPHPRSSDLCSRETVMRMAHHAAMTVPWERGRPARIAAPRAR